MHLTLHIKSSLNTNNCSNISLVCFVKDHCYPITSEKLKVIAIKANKGGADNMLKYIIDLKWTRRHDKITKLETLIDDEFKKKKNHIIVLPEGTKIEEAMEEYMYKTNYFMEHMHWDNKGVLDGFLDHNNNMYVLYNKYDNRKAIC